MYPTIVIAAWNRPKALKRLLTSMEQANYPAEDVALVISLDGGAHPEVVALVNNYEWKYGVTEIIQQEEHLGLKEHILKCGDLSRHYGDILLLEDDLVVGPGFFRFADQAVIAYTDDPKISGISLYSYRIAESCRYPFEPIMDGSDVYFMQFAASWGQVWTAAWWARFREWIALHPGLPSDPHIPGYLQDWGVQSWKKHFIHYLIEEDLYFVFPRSSHTTNFGDPGTNSDAGNLYQVPLEMGVVKPRFKDFALSNIKYDAWFELLPACLKNMAPQFVGFDLTVDVYGQKPIEALGSSHVLTSRKGAEPEMSFGTALQPLLLNAIEKSGGDDLHLLKREQVGGGSLSRLNFFPQVNALGNWLFEEFRLNPSISLVIPAGKEVEASILSCVSQQYPALQLIVVYEEEQQKELTGLMTKYEGKVTWVSVAGSVHVYDLIRGGLKKATGEVMGWLLPGMKLKEQALRQLGWIFGRMGQVNWLAGIEGYKEGISPAKHRWSQGLLLKRVKKNQHLLPEGQVFWRNGIWERSGALLDPKYGDSAPLELWSRMLGHSPLNTVCVSFLEQGSLLPVPLAAKGAKTDLLPAIQATVPAVSAVKRLANALTWPFFKGDVPYLRFYYNELNHLPDLIRFDSETNSWYLSRY